MTPRSTWKDGIDIFENASRHNTVIDIRIKMEISCLDMFLTTNHITTIITQKQQAKSKPTKSMVTSEKAKNITAKPVKALNNHCKSKSDQQNKLLKDIVK